MNTHIAYNRMENFKSLDGFGTIFIEGSCSFLFIHNNEIHGAMDGTGIYIKAKMSQL